MYSEAPIEIQLYYKVSNAHDDLNIAIYNI